MYLGLDWGQKKIGLAVAHVDMAIASAIGVIKNDDRVMQSLADVIDEYDVERIVIGKSEHALHNDNVLHIEKFGTRCSKELCVPVEFFAEMFSTREAQNNLKSANRKNVHMKDDAESARIILQSYIDAQKDKL